MQTVLSFSQAIEAVKNTLDIVAVVSSTVTLRKAGRNYTGLCPFHKEKSPSFSVSREKNLFKCFGCGEGGDALTFLMKTRGKPFAEVIREEASRMGLVIADTPHTGPKKEDQDKQALLLQATADWFKTQLTPGVLNYLANRQLNHDAISRFGLGYAPDHWDGLRKHIGQCYPEVTDHQLSEAGLVIKREDRPGAYDRFRDRLMIPIHNDQGVVVGFGGRGLTPDSLPKYLNSPETLLYTKSRILYGLHWAKEAIKTKRRALVMEGYFDVMRAHLAGFTEAVATCGTALTKEHVTLLLRNGVDTLYLAFDQDAAGQRAILSALDVLDTVSSAVDLKIRVVQLPQGKDPDDFLRQQPAEAFEAVIASAMTHWQFRCEAALAGLNLQVMEDRLKATNQLVATLQQLKHPVLRAEFARVYAPQLALTEADLLHFVREPRNASKSWTPRNSKGLVARRTADVTALKSIMKPGYVLAEIQFFSALLDNPVAYQVLHPYCAQLDWVTPGAIQLANVVAFLPADLPFEAVKPQLMREMQTDDTLRHFLSDVFITDTDRHHYEQHVLKTTDTVMRLQDATYLVNLVATVKRVLKKAQLDSHAKTSVEKLYAMESQLKTEQHKPITPEDQSEAGISRIQAESLDVQYTVQELTAEKWAMLNPSSPEEPLM
jgi:DNA primase